MNYKCSLSHISAGHRPNYTQSLAQFDTDLVSFSLQLKSPFSQLLVSVALMNISRWSVLFSLSLAWVGSLPLFIFAKCGSVPLTAWCPVCPPWSPKPAVAWASWPWPTTCGPPSSPWWSASCSCSSSNPAWGRRWRATGWGPAPSWPRPTPCSTSSGELRLRGEVRGQQLEWVWCSV